MQRDPNKQLSVEYVHKKNSLLFSIVRSSLCRNIFGTIFQHCTQVSSEKRIYVRVQQAVVYVNQGKNTDCTDVAVPQLLVGYSTSIQNYFCDDQITSLFGYEHV